jgi:hypothetical protein
MEEGMKSKHAVLAAVVALVAAMTLASVAAAGPEPAKTQRVAITSQAAKTTNVSPFVLTPLQGGALKADSGSLVAGSTWTSKTVMRDGQRVDIYAGDGTFKGKRGTIVMRFRAEYVEAGSGYHPGTGTWKILRGTGAYAGITGAGRYASVWLERGPWSSRLEGFFTLP